MAQPRGPDAERQQRKFAFLVWLLLAATTAAQIPWLASMSRLGIDSAYLASFFVIANAQLVIRLRFLPRPEPPPSWWERWVIWPYFTWTVWAGWYLPVGIADLCFPLRSEVRLFALFGSALAALYSTGVPYRRVVIREIQIAIEGLPAAAHNMRLLQLTDLHLGPMVPERRASRWMDKVNTLDVDHVLLTGDLVASGTEFIPALTRVLSRLKPRGSIFAIMGNHDYFGQAGQALIEMHESLGHTLLRNRSTELCSGLRIAGVDDAWRKLTDLDSALSEVDSLDKVILLSHDPDLFPDSAAQGVSLQVSGHVHGGQIAIPGLGRSGSILRLFSVPWISGHYRLATSQMWLGAGVGTTGIPVRVGVPSELVVLKLVPE